MKYSTPDKLNDKNQISSTPNFYETSNMRDYKGLAGCPADNARPATSKFYSETPTGNTGYGEEFSWKTVEKDDSGRPGTASGERNKGYQKRSGMKWVNVTLENGIEMTHIINFSNPHPKETFMVWKFPSKVPIEENGYPNEHMMKEICKDKIRSTYQVDYTGSKQGEKRKPREPSKFLIETPHEAPVTLNTTVRVDYQSPNQKGFLKSNTTRYGCNANRANVATGAVPTVIRGAPAMNLEYDTSYTTEYAAENKRQSNISSYIDNMSKNEKKVIVDMLNTVNKAANGQNKEQERISGWDGPTWKS